MDETKKKKKRVRTPIKTLSARRIIEYTCILLYRIARCAYTIIYTIALRGTTCWLDTFTTRPRSRLLLYVFVRFLCVVPTCMHLYASRKTRRGSKAWNRPDSRRTLWLNRKRTVPISYTYVRTCTYRVRRVFFAREQRDSSRIRYSSTLRK